MTYSIVAQDKKTGQLWVAVQTHWFWVGNNVPWLESWVWAIATQAQTNMDYWKIWLKMMQQWKKPQDIIKELWDSDDGFSMRQVAMIDNYWNIWVHTWKDCVSYAGYLVWDGFIVQWNILKNKEVLATMKESYEKNMDKDFVLRLYECIKSWEQAWWELRWVQSAAIRIVSNKKEQYDVMNLRIDDNKEPLKEIKRQIDIQKAYNFLNKAEQEWDTGNVEKSVILFDKALEIIPNSKEILFWKAFMLQNRWRWEEAQEIFAHYFQNEPKWKELIQRLNKVS